MVHAFQRKLLRYDGPGALGSECRGAGWTVDVMPVEVGTLGFVAESTMRACKNLGAWSKELKTTLEEATLRARYAIYIERKTPGWCLDAWRVRRPVRKAAEASA